MGDGWSIIGRKTYQITTGGDLTRRGGFSIRTLFILILQSYTVLNPYKITFVLVQYVFYLFLLEFISDCIVFLVFFLFLNVIGQQLLRSGGDALFRPSASDENNSEYVSHPIISIHLTLSFSSRFTSRHLRYTVLIGELKRNTYQSTAHLGINAGTNTTNNIFGVQRLVVFSKILK